MSRIVPHPTDPLRWFWDSLRSPTYVYDDTLTFFDFVIDENRFAGGCNFVCRRCGHTAMYVREDEAPLHRAFIVVHVICGVCGQTWKRRGIKPLYETIFEDWE